MYNILQWDHITTADQKYTREKTGDIFVSTI